MTTGARGSGLAVVVAGGLALLVGCQEPVPAKPTYTTDLKPLFEANCVRCHGAGGTENEDPRTGVYAADKGISHLNIYANQGDCDPDAGPSAPPCVNGAQYAATMGGLQLFVHSTTIVRMPPAPSEPLTDWELSLIDRWIANGSPDDQATDAGVSQ